MSLGILNSVASLTAENSLALTSANLQKTLQQLSTGLRINSGADDAAGLSISSGLQANISALVQSQNNANNGIGFLQVADGALSQVSNLLNRAVTLATEASNSGLTSQQLGSANAEYQSILTEINQIGATTAFNGTQVFTDGNTTPISLANDGTAISGVINPADTISGSLTLTTLIPGDPGVTQSIATQDYGFVSIAFVTPGANLTGGITVNSTTSGSNAVTSAINVVNNSDGSVFIPINSFSDELSGTLTLSTVVPGTSAAPQDITLVNNGSDTLVAAINPANTLSGTFSVTATTSATGGVQSAVTLASGGAGTTITGTIPPADSLGGSLTITSTIPQSGGVSSAVTLANGASITGNVANGNTLSGSVTFTSTTAASGGVSTAVNLNNNGATVTGTIVPGDTVTGNVTLTSTIPSHAGTTQTLTFASSGSGATEAITSSAIVAGSTLAGNLVVNSTYIDSSGMQKGTVGTVNLANYQNLSSSNAATATAAANQLATDLTSSLGATTGSTYTASITGGVLTVKTSKPWDTASDSVDLMSTGTGLWSDLDPMTTGAVLSGTLTFAFVTGGVTSNISLNMAKYQGITSNDASTVTDTLQALSSYMTGPATNGTTFTASLDAAKKLKITSNKSGVYNVTSQFTRTVNTGEQMLAASSNVTFAASGSGASMAITSSQITTGMTLTGAFVFNTNYYDIYGNLATKSMKLDLANYQGLASSNASTADFAAQTLAWDIQQALGPITGSDYTGSMTGGVVKITTSRPMTTSTRDENISLKILAGTYGLVYADPIAPGTTVSGILGFGVSVGQGPVPAGISVDMANYQGITSSNAATRAAALTSLSQIMTTQAGNGITLTASLSYNHLVISSNIPLNHYFNADYPSTFQITGPWGETLGVGDSYATDTPVIAAANTPTSISLSNVATASLQSTLQTKLGSNYAVTYNNTTGALNIGVSSTGSAAGITTIASSANTIQQKTPVISPVATPTVINLNGKTSANLLSTLQAALSSSIYAVSYNASTGALTVSETAAALSAGTTITSTTNNLNQTTPLVAAQVTPVTVNLNGVATSGLQSKLSTALGSNYTVGYNTGTGALSIAISAAGTAAGVQSIAFSGSPTQTTPFVGGTSDTKNVDLTGVTSANLLTTLQNDLGASYNVTYDTSSGALNISAKVAGTNLTANNGNAQQTGPGTLEVDTPTNLDLTGQTGSTLASYLSNQLPWWNYTVTENSNGITVGTQWWDQWAYGIQSVKASNVQVNETTPAVLPVTIPTTVNLTGVATSDLQQTLQNALGSDYGVYYDNGGGFLEIYLDTWGDPNKPSSFSCNSTMQQNTGSIQAISTASTINLTGVAPANLASSIVSQLGSEAGNYDVTYDTNSGALNIALSAAGASSGITSIASNTSNFMETVPTGTTGLNAFNVFTGDGTGSGNSFDATVGSLTSANVGTSGGNAGQDLSGTVLSTNAAAASTLRKITTAIDNISGQRGAVGANINRLMATASNASSAQVNLTAAMNSIMNADLGKTVANMTQYNVLQSTGMAALQQSNQSQQALLKLIQ